MKTVVVYESMYGNTHEIASAIAAGLESTGVVELLPVASAPSDGVPEVDLLVVGGPTHVHGMSRPASRAAAVETAEKDAAVDLDADAPGPGLREWIAGLPKVEGVLAAAFDTRIDKALFITGSAARSIAKHLRHHHFELLTEPASFLVEDSDGPLKAGEVERARAWGAELARRWSDQHASSGR